MRGQQWSTNVDAPLMQLDYFLARVLPACVKLCFVYMSAAKLQRILHATRWRHLVFPVGGDCQFRPPSNTPVMNFSLCALLAKTWMAAPSHRKTDAAVKRQVGVLQPSRKSPEWARACVLARGIEAPVCNCSMSDGQSARVVEGVEWGFTASNYAKVLAPLLPFTWIRYGNANRHDASHGMRVSPTTMVSYLGDGRYLWCLLWVIVFWWR
jgi:hypothetical protein